MLSLSQQMYRALISKPKYLMPASFSSHSHGVKRQLSVNALPNLDVAICGSDEGCLIEHWVDAYNAAGNSKRKMVVGGNWKCNGDLKSLTGKAKPGAPVSHQ